MIYLLCLFNLNFAPDAPKAQTETAAKQDAGAAAEWTADDTKWLAVKLIASGAVCIGTKYALGYAGDYFMHELSNRFCWEMACAMGILTFIFANLRPIARRLGYDVNSAAGKIKEEGKSQLADTITAVVEHPGLNKFVTEQASKASQAIDAKAKALGEEVTQWLEKPNGVMDGVAQAGAKAVLEEVGKKCDPTVIGAGVGMAVGCAAHLMTPLPLLFGAAGGLLGWFWKTGGAADAAEKPEGEAGSPPVGATNVPKPPAPWAPALAVGGAAAPAAVVVVATRGTRNVATAPETTCWDGVKGQAEKACDWIAASSSSCAEGISARAPTREQILKFGGWGTPGGLWCCGILGPIHALYATAGLGCAVEGVIRRDWISEKASDLKGWCGRNVCGGCSGAWLPSNPFRKPTSLAVPNVPVVPQPAGAAAEGGAGVLGDKRPAAASTVEQSLTQGRTAPVAPQKRKQTKETAAGSVRGSAVSLSDAEREAGSETGVGAWWTPLQEDSTSCFGIFSKPWAPAAERKAIVHAAQAGVNGGQSLPDAAGDAKARLPLANEPEGSTDSPTGSSRAGDGSGVGVDEQDQIASGEDGYYNLAYIAQLLVDCVSGIKKSSEQKAGPVAEMSRGQTGFGCKELRNQYPFFSKSDNESEQQRATTSSAPDVAFLDDRLPSFPNLKYKM